MSGLSTMVVSVATFSLTTFAFLAGAFFFTTATGFAVLSLFAASIFSFSGSSCIFIRCSSLTSSIGTRFHTFTPFFFPTIQFVPSLPFIMLPGCSASATYPRPRGDDSLPVYVYSELFTHCFFVPGAID